MPGTLRWSLARDAVAGEPGDDLCDGLDNGCNGEADDQTIDLLATYVGDLDGDSYMHVFADAFDPGDLATCVAGNDDGPNGRADSELVGQPIAAGQQLWVVVSTFYDDLDANNRFGDYTLSITTQP